MAALKMQRLLVWGAKAVSSAPCQQPSSWLCGRANIRKASTYRAAVLREFGQDLQIKDMKRNKLKGNEVRVGVHSCGVNASDILMIENKYDRTLTVPFVPGFEVCGEVLEVGRDVTTMAVGSKVIGINKEGLGGYAEESIISEQNLWTVDHGVSVDHGAALVDTYATALIGLHRRARVHEGSTVLVTAAAGGLGLAAVDLASSVYKAKVIGVCGTEDKAELVRQKGAWAALKYNKKHIEAKVKEVTDGRGVDVVFDAIGGDAFHDCFSWVCHEGTVIVAGFASRVIPNIETGQLLPKAVSLVGLSLSHYQQANNAVYRQVVEDVIDMHEMGLIKPHISARFNIEETAEAFNFMRERKSTGKVILDLI
ncbi:Quinone oxidoreductase-like protein 2 [Chionoecetes opilio]|uniref:Quinone oxidoreductase-like protein 2 n=1 Tax=Chionoecetes opilio TaxID=41210 RepID=A0A8J4YJH0_CHIOP|nr:Quinone oxidoreductase-like protein 2 [Chionoecetes opilio]